MYLPENRKTGKDREIMASRQVLGINVTSWFSGLIII